MDSLETLRPVFAALVHRVTGGRDDGSHNPLAVEGAGWPGFVGFAGSRPGSSASAETALFASAADGCLAAALMFQFRDCQGVQSAYRTGDPLQLAASIEASPLRGTIDLTGFSDEVRALAGSDRDARSGSGAARVARLVLAEMRAGGLAPLRWTGRIARRVASRP